ncbi:MAG TPA: hypothetical protein VLW06_01805 [Terriglobales bacterium]|nr:hypothetical protein [Terriglobales bacterium]
MSLQTKIVRTMGWWILTVLAVAAASSAQVLNSAAKPIALQAVLSDSVTVQLSANAVDFNLTSGSANNPGNTAITAKTIWTLTPLIGFVSTYAFFSNSTAALTDGAGDNIPSADFQISDNGGAYQALTTTAPFGGANAGLRLFSTLVLGNNRTSSHTDVMSFNINLSSLPNLPANTYTGTLTIQAQAF